MDEVPGVQQKLLSRRVPQVENWLQLPPHPLRSQKATFLVADRQLVPGAARQVAPPLYTTQDPPQTPWALMVQFTNKSEIRVRVVEPVFKLFDGHQVGDNLLRQSEQLAAILVE